MWNVNAVLAELSTQPRGPGSEQSGQAAEEILGRTGSLGLQIGRHLLGIPGSEGGTYIRGSRANYGGLRTDLSSIAGGQEAMQVGG